MSYYNFNDHFWSPQTVCSQTVVPKSNKKNARRVILKNILTIGCIAVWTPLLLQMPVPGVKVNKNQPTSSLDSSNSSGDRLVFKRERFLLYFSTQQR
ncbi:hypothetical protein [Mastigocladopsis repens]|uniref:hypothetical protein n=1 Tax=Mastigocladopsis repens TaxID=221287 RepID=UPI000474A1AE|nr:hypothetical protein [Mastigocladopsis repens]